MKTTPTKLTTKKWECPGMDGESYVVGYRDEHGKRRTLAHVYDRDAAHAIAATPDLLTALEETTNALLYIAQEAEARAGVPKPIIGGARHHAILARAAIAKATTPCL